MALVRPETRSRGSRPTIRLSPNTETAQPRSSPTSTRISGLEGDALRMVAEAALKAKVDTNLFGDVASQLGLDAEGAAGFLDQLTVAAQGSGVDIDTLTRTIGKSGARWQAAGGDMDDLTATVIKAADEFGPSGLRGAMSEIHAGGGQGTYPGRGLA